jgi:hypothetical protein
MGGVGTILVLLSFVPYVGFVLGIVGLVLVQTNLLWKDGSQRDHSPEWTLRRRSLTETRPGLTFICIRRWSRRIYFRQPLSRTASREL